MVRRHPHVFGDREVSGSAEVLQNWEDIKRDERAANGESGVLQGVPSSLPALLKASRMTETAAAVGFDWRKPEDVMVKMHEEMAELEEELVKGEASADERVRAEMGDVLFVMANLARHLGVEPETALQGTNTTFMQRFQAMEERAAASGRNFREMDLAEQDALWEEVKADEGRERKDPEAWRNKGPEREGGSKL
jgi:MazG family protein